MDRDDTEIKVKMFVSKGTMKMAGDKK